MEHKRLSRKDLGIIILSRFYLFLIVLHILPLYVFSTGVYLFGQKLSSFPVVLAIVLFIAFLYFLYDAIWHIKLIGFFLAFIFQLIFVINNSQMLFGKIPLLTIKGEKIAFLAVEKPLVVISIIVNFLLSSLLAYYIFILFSELNKRKIGKLRKQIKKAIKAK
ncbi:MAG: hypothetical protein M0R20_00180 [Candidatus Omnitrophica bacterium]|jgi:predicted neutral ceramidase superfamily lipid hydrolase|nr:hypothetical protein [Candidatus Omnitrophota bacterium]